ncbi:MAG: transposase [Saprospiraceae bacterium]|nr:transposase [Saprospiraceae bacterium]MBX2891734.1 transposase [Saprospiraceae bacterium]MBX2891821.1 transposase [Saprospiraceae bacterium]MBX2891828.1 transposase [Saprospiraceae bacterium]MBX2891893.1 transposase [Saprospiraceae bacterium]
MASLIQACVRNGHCRLESLSEATEAYRARKKSSLLQQAKRWLGNKWTDWQTFYLPFAQYFLLGLADKGELVLVMDGSQTGSANTTLMLSVMCRGFAIPVAWVVKKGEKGHFPEEMHTDLVKMVAHFCPPGFRIVLLGDGEFDGQGLRQWCVENGWLFVVRTSSDRLIDFDGEVARFDSLRTTRSICFIGGALPLANAVYWRGKGHSKPLFLLTNLELGHEACHYYKRRFKIETLFKHLKSAGFYLHKTRLKCPKKLANLIIVAAFSFVLSFCMGVFIKEKEPVERLEVIVRKDRLPKIGPIAIAQLAIRNDCDCVINFFSELSKNFDWVFT